MGSQSRGIPAWFGLEGGLKTHLNPKLGCHPLNHIIEVPWSLWLYPPWAPHDLPGAGLGTGTPAKTQVLELPRVWQSWERLEGSRKGKALRKQKE